MLLVIDIGNTNISFGVFKGDKLIRRFDISTKAYQCHCEESAAGGRRSNLFKKIASVPFAALRAPRNDTGRDACSCNDTICDAIICSVVPQAASVLIKDLTRIFGKQPYIIGKDVKVPVKNCYSRPKEVGQDRLVNAYAGIKLYGAPLIVVDFGTAITFDVISKNKEYLGGMILPGLGLSLDALSWGTALLPKIKLSAPQELIGRNTKNSMLSGVVYGFAALTDELAKKIKNKIGVKAKVIATGGNIKLIAKYCRNINKIDSDLTMKGIKLIYEKI
ncbi:MAG: type III pantothenate kinase [Candidatus Omnitrophota bacterium]